MLSNRVILVRPNSSNHPNGGDITIPATSTRPCAGATSTLGFSASLHVVCVLQSKISNGTLLRHF